MRVQDERRRRRERSATAQAAPPEELVVAGLSNHALSRILARDQREIPPKPPLRTGRQVDTIFDTSPFMKDVVGAKLGKGSVSKAMKIDNEKAFEAAWVEYAQRSVNPQTDKNFTEEEARKFLAVKGVRAFQDEDRGEIHVRKDRADLGTQIHEGMHLFADDRWRRKMNYNVNEGVTEYFTRKVGPEVDVHRDDSSFLREYTSATHLVNAATEPVVAAAYFEGDLTGLKKAVDARGKGTFDQWLGFLDVSDFKSANKLLKQ
jgi:hypothetical protein